MNGCFARYAEIPAIIFGANAISVFYYGGYSAYQILAAALFSVVAYAIIFTSDLKRRSRAELNYLGSAFENIRARMLFYHSTFFTSIAESSPVEQNAVSIRVAELMSEISNRILLGQTASDAVLFASNHISDNPALRQELKQIRADLCGSQSEYAAVRNSCKRIEGNMKRQRVASGYSSQRYATAAIVSTTVIPSFVIFTSVGISMAGGSGFAAGATGFAMLVLIPLLYLLIKSRM